MELRHLRYFVAVGEALNFTKVPARLRVAQPALSRQITAQNLEWGKCGQAKAGEVLNEIRALLSVDLREETIEIVEG